MGFAFPQQVHSFISGASEDCRAGDLLSEQDGRSAGGDEIEEVGREVARVISPELESGDAEWLAWRTSSPDGPVVWPSGKPEGVGPSADSGEEMHLSKPGKVGWLHVEN